MPRPPSDSVQITMRVPKKWLADADELAKLISRPGLEATRTDALRAALAHGLIVLSRSPLSDPQLPDEPPATSAAKKSKR